MHEAKEITKKAYNNTINSIKVKYKMDFIFMNSKNSKTSDSDRLLLNPIDKIYLKGNDKYIA